MFARNFLRSALALGGFAALASCGGGSTSTPAAASFADVQGEISDFVDELNALPATPDSNLPVNQDISYRGAIVVFETNNRLEQFSPLGVPGLDLDFASRAPTLDLDYAAIGELDIVIGYPAPGGRGTITGSADNFYELRNPNGGVDAAGSRGSIDGSLNFGRNGVISGDLDKVSGETASYELRSGDFGFILPFGNNADAIAGGAIGNSSASGRARVNAGAVFLGDRQ